MTFIPTGTSLVVYGYSVSRCKKVAYTAVYNVNLHMYWSSEAPANMWWKRTY